MSSTSEYDDSSFENRMSKAIDDGTLDYLEEKSILQSKLQEIEERNRTSKQVRVAHASQVAHMSQVAQDDGRTRKDENRRLKNIEESIKQIERTVLRMEASLAHIEVSIKDLQVKRKNEVVHKVEKQGNVSNVHRV